MTGKLVDSKVTGMCYIWTVGEKAKGIFMTHEKKVFGMTLEEVGEVKKSVAEWTDDNRPMVSKSQGGDFASAFVEGSQLLRSDETFADVFKNC